MATVLSIPPLPPSPRPLHPLNPPTPPASATPIFKFTASISTRPTTPSSIHSAPDTPPASPSDDTSSIESTESSLTIPSEPSFSFALYPADKHTLLRREKGNVYLISADVLAEAYDQVRSQPLPPAGEVFPWLHGLNPRNAGQLCFFNAQCSATRVPPINIGYRGLTVVHVPAPFGCYRPGRLLGAVNHTEILGRSQRDGHFVDPDPLKGICLRNFHIQTPKMALLSDIVVYSPRGGNNKEVLDVAEKISQAQRLIRMKYSTNPAGTPNYSTFVVTDDIDAIWENHRDIVAIEPSGRITEHKIEFLVREREEMKDLTRATQISHNVYLGNTADIYNTVGEYVTADGRVESKGFDVLIEAKDMADIASPAVLRDAEVILNGGVPPREVSLSRLGWGPAPSLTRPLSLEFPSSTPLSTARHDPNAIVSFCEWMYHIAHSPSSAASETSTCEDTPMTDAITPGTSPMSDRHILIHCTDGYTESTFLALAYLIYAEGITAHEAWVKLHTDLGRSFFAFEADLKTLNCLQSYLLARSPVTTSFHLSSPAPVPAWFTNPNFDGSFPSRILDHMYLGNLQHANNPEMLRALGIKRVLSIGERVDWDVQTEEEAGMQIMYLDNVQDNGVDPLLEYIDLCLQFLDEGLCAGESTLVHCRVGVSRSASICIAEVMRRESKTLPRAYLYVRARRLNVIIQPNLRFMYELMKWEEMEHARKLERMALDPFTDGDDVEKREYKREMEWAWLCKEIADLNKTYTTTSS